eukprot:1395176-Amorphochlora_amoeboformis.AAC.1
MEAKLSLWRALIRPSLEYGAEVWDLNVKESRKLETLQLRALKGRAATEPRVIGPFAYFWGNPD